jgi:hypothetical protein
MLGLKELYLAYVSFNYLITYVLSTALTLSMTRLNILLIGTRPWHGKGGSEWLICDMGVGLAPRRGEGGLPDHLLEVS